MSGDENPIRDTAEGITRGVLSFAWEKASAAIRSVSNRELAFIDPDIVRRVLERRKTAEWLLLKRYLGDQDDKWKLAQAGLALRDLASHPEEHDRLQRLRGRIKDRFGTKKLQIAELVQLGIVTSILAEFAKEGRTEAEIRAEVAEILDDVLGHFIFVQALDTVPGLKQRVRERLAFVSPQIALGTGEVRKIIRQLGDDLDASPTLRVVAGRDQHTSFLFVFSSEQWKSISEKLEEAERQSKLRKRTTR